VISGHLRQQYSWWGTFAIVVALSLIGFGVLRWATDKTKETLLGLDVRIPLQAYAGAKVRRMFCRVWEEVPVYDSGVQVDGDLARHDLIDVVHRQGSWADHPGLARTDIKGRFPLLKIWLFVRARGAVGLKRNFKQLPLDETLDRRCGPAISDDYSDTKSVKFHFVSKGVVFRNYFPVISRQHDESSLSEFHRGRHDVVLSLHESVLIPEHDGLNDQEEQRESRQPKRRLSIRRFGVSVLLVLSGLFLILGNHDNKGRFIRAAFIYGGFILIAAGGFLWWIAFAFPRGWL
jgi:hypothetical protein